MIERFVGFGFGFGFGFVFFAGVAGSEWRSELEVKPQPLIKKQRGLRNRVRNRATWKP